jgi:signal transduction histidine kinase/ActR/RegA family two-component response regulator
MEELSEKGYLNNVKTDYYRKDGSLCPVEFNATFLRDRKGNPAGAVAAIRDISKRKEMEAQLLQAEKLKSLGELAGGVAHDFNNVLAAVLGRAQMLKRMIDSPGGNHERRKSINELKKGLEIIENAALDGSETVRRIQEFSRKRDDDRYFEEVDLKKVIEGAVEFTKVRWKDAAESKGITYNIRTRLPSLPTIEGSASELREVFTNLINNALDAMPEGGKINMIASFNRNRIVVKVRDSGTGIPKKILDRVFDPFFTTKGPQSTGLGMSVSFGIINRHSGTIIVDSTDGRGTTFTITLPVAKKAEQREAPQLAIKTSKKASILIIEDEKDVRELLRDLLTIDGHDVQGACDGYEGIELFRQRSFDMVFTDLGMPGMSGWEVAEEIKKIDQKTPVILITGWEVLYKEKEIKKSGIDLVVNKPFQIDQILRIVKEGIQIGERTEGSNCDS